MSGRVCLQFSAMEAGQSLVATLWQLLELTDASSRRENSPSPRFTATQSNPLRLVETTAHLLAINLLGD